MSLSNIASRGVWGVGRRAQATSAGAPQTRQPPMLPPPCCFPFVFFNLSFSLVSHPGHTITLVPHRHHTTPVFLSHVRIPVLDHPNSKLWAGGQGRQAQRRRGTRYATNPVAEPQTRWGTVAQPAPRATPPATGTATADAALAMASTQRRSTTAGASAVSSASAGWGSARAARPRRHHELAATGPMNPIAQVRSMPGGGAGAILRADRLAISGHKRAQTVRLPTIQRRRATSMHIRRHATKPLTSYCSRMVPLFPLRSPHGRQGARREQRGCVGSSGEQPRNCAEHAGQPSAGYIP